jgi:hydrogenase maturation protease
MTRVPCRGPGSTRPIAVVGIGSLILSDDGCGIHAVRRLQAEPRVASAARLIDGGTIGPNLLAELTGCTRLLIIDAVDAGLPPGSMIWMDFGNPGSTKPATRNAHQSGIPVLLDDLRLLGGDVREVLVAGIQPATTALGTQLSPEVAGALPALTAEVARQVERWAAAVPNEQQDQDRFRGHI